ncbi:hypothetical protein H310_13339 [Aphanomyces invadans]|uniref:Retrotransposon gag domain-containing protein n=1 Tax=Aphanomyces invadans TaxID=157072 RepID=A0A024TE28_9STRA|nr:hypothetical protein H310_13339 [Aphanomyces invadans]ETV92274.1 hypothetical protein H310_13339 [Aphanomyces invadans]|eukprot:XP_008879025.1 hypothetical protein H310_13339 [Aphanomyces invadans]
MDFKHFVHVFNGKSFNEWECRLNAYLEFKEVLEVVDGTMPPTHADFISKNRLARAIILAGLDNHHVRMVSKQPTAASMMKLLSERYGTKSFMGESYLFQNLMEIRIRHNESARAYCDRFKIHLDEVLDAGMTIDDKLQVHIFLNSLDERFESFINFQAHVFQHGEVIDATTLPKLFCCNYSRGDPELLLVF